MRNEWQGSRKQAEGGQGRPAISSLAPRSRSARRHASRQRVAPWICAAARARRTSAAAAHAVRTRPIRMSNSCTSAFRSVASFRRADASLRAAPPRAQAPSTVAAQSRRRQSARSFSSRT